MSRKPQVTDGEHRLRKSFSANFFHRQPSFTRNQPVDPVPARARTPRFDAPTVSSSVDSASEKDTTASVQTTTTVRIVRGLGRDAILNSWDDVACRNRSRSPFVRRMYKNPNNTYLNITPPDSPDEDVRMWRRSEKADEHTVSEGSVDTNHAASIRSSMTTNVPLSDNTHNETIRSGPRKIRKKRSFRSLKSATMPFAVPSPPVSSHEEVPPQHESLPQPEEVPEPEGSSWLASNFAEIKTQGDDGPNALEAVEKWTYGLSNESSSSLVSSKDVMCATALTPAKARMVNVTAKPKLAVVIPPRTSSLRDQEDGTTPYDDPPQIDTPLSPWSAMLLANAKHDGASSTIKRPSTSHTSSANSHNDLHHSLDEIREAIRVKRDTKYSPKHESFLESPEMLEDNTDSLPESRSASIDTSFSTLQGTESTVASAVAEDHVPTKQGATDEEIVILSTIWVSTHEFPDSLLTMESPCITSIRTAIYGDARPSTPKSPKSSRKLSSQLYPADWRPYPSIRSRKSVRHGPKGFLGSLKRLAWTDSTSPPHHHHSNSPTRKNSDPSPPGTIKTTSSFHPHTSSSESIDTTDTAPSLFNSIFPSTLASYQNSLYAHLLCLIYIDDAHSSHDMAKENTFYIVPSKAADLLNIPRLSKTPVCGDHNTVTVAEMETALTRCVEKLIAVLSGFRQSLEEVEKEDDGEGEGNGGIAGTLITALVELVRAREMSLVLAGREKEKL